MKTGIFTDLSRGAQTLDILCMWLDSNKEYSPVIAISKIKEFLVVSKYEPESPLISYPMNTNQPLHLPRLISDLNQFTASISALR